MMSVPPIFYFTLIKHALFVRHWIEKNKDAGEMYAVLLSNFYEVADECALQKKQRLADAARAKKRYEEMQDKLNKQHHDEVEQLKVRCHRETQAAKERCKGGDVAQERVDFQLRLELIALACNEYADRNTRDKKLGDNKKVN